MKVAFLFPGQGAVEPRAGLELAARFGECDRLLRRASELSDTDLPRLLRRGGASLRRSSVLQPLTVAISLGALHALRRGGVRPDYVAGLSLGELTAWCAAGAIEPDVCLELAADRGRLMSRQARRIPGGMVALRSEDVEDALALGNVWLASHPAPDEWVVSGRKTDLRRVRGRSLAVEGAWHSPIMAGALAPLRRLLRGTPSRPLHTPLVANRHGNVVQDTDRIPDLLADQLVRPAWWTECLETLSELGVTDFITVGSGRVLRSLLRRTLGGSVRVHGTDDLGTINQTLHRFAGGGLAA